MYFKLWNINEDLVVYMIGIITYYLYQILFSAISMESCQSNPWTDMRNIVQLILLARAHIIYIYLLISVVLSLSI